jgi:hypothetical protein
MLDLIGPPISMPANGARFFTTLEESLVQPIGVLQFAWNRLDPFLFNASFDESLILYDSNYYTSIANNLTQVNIKTLFYIDQVLSQFPLKSLIIEIGCGQGELIEHLRIKGLNAFGFDPALRRPNHYLYKSLYDSRGKTDLQVDLFILRCVLPHIQNPWEYLQALFYQKTDVKILIEYQRIEFMIENKLWFNLGHSHINQFTLQDFQSHFNVLNYGEFSNGEWQWVLIANNPLALPRDIQCTFKQEIINLLEEKTKFLNRAGNFGPIALFGAAGKGIVLAEALIKFGANLIFAIDSSKIRSDKFLEVSGVQVVLPEKAINILPIDTNVLVCNPNHIGEAKDALRNKFEIILPMNLY